jgi:hypothetical protein
MNGKSGKYQIWSHVWTLSFPFEPIPSDFGDDLLAIAQKCQRKNFEELEIKIDNPNYVFSSYGVAQSLKEGDNHELTG